MRKLEYNFVFLYNMFESLYEIRSLLRLNYFPRYDIHIWIRLIKEKYNFNVLDTIGAQREIDKNNNLNYIGKISFEH